MLLIGDGTLRKHPDIWRSWTITGGMSLHGKQVAILKRGLQLLKVGGRLVYSTCSLNPIENEAVIASVVSQLISHVELVSPDAIPGLHTSPGMKTWRVADPRTSSNSLHQDPSLPIEFYDSYSSVPTDRRSVLHSSMFPLVDLDIPLERCMRIFPHQNNSGGFFVAVLTKNSTFSCVDQETDASFDAERIEASMTEDQSVGVNASGEIRLTNGESSCGRKKRRENRTGLHTHRFELVDLLKNDLLQVSEYFGFHLTSPMEWNRERALQEVVPVDFFDLRWLATDGCFRIQQWSQASDDSYTNVVINLCNEPTLSAKECQTVWGPRNENDKLSLDRLTFRKHTEGRLYYLSSALQKIVAEVSAEI